MLFLTHQQLFLLLPMEPDDKEADPVLGQALPGSDEVHLCLQQVEVLHIGVGLKDLLTQLKYGCYFSILSVGLYLNIPLISSSWQSAGPHSPLLLSPLCWG